ncbi:MAG: hypothetical protein AB7F25_02825 [Deferribacterales bacterium]
MKTRLTHIIYAVVGVIFVFGIIFWNLKSEQKQNHAFDGAALQKIIDEEKQCPEKLYGILLGMRYSYPEVYDTVSEVARVKDFSCEEYLAFIEKNKSSNQ